MQKQRALVIVNHDKHSNDEKMVVKNLRHAARIGRETGTTEAVAAFDAAAAKFANPAPLIACNLFERLPVVVPEMEDWEAEFVDMSERMRELYAKRYPAEFWERHTGPSKKDSDSASGSGGGAGAGASVGASGMEAYYAGGGDEADSDDEDDMAAADFVPAPRWTAADDINNTRSLDRRLDQRLVFLAQRKSDGAWVFPGAKWGGEGTGTMRDAAKDALLDAFGDELDFWYPGNAPMGHHLQVFDEATQERTGSYGAKLFFYRVQLLGGFIDLGAKYADYRWLTHDETAEYVGDELYSYIRQVL